MCCAVVACGAGNAGGCLFNYSAAFFEPVINPAISVTFVAVGVAALVAACVLTTLFFREANRRSAVARASRARAARDGAEPPFKVTYLVNPSHPSPSHPQASFAEGAGEGGGRRL